MRLRNRIVKATYYTDPDLCRMPRNKREFYRSLWACAEDSACLEDDMFGVKLAAWPSPLDRDMTVKKFEEWRDELIADGKLVGYEVDGDSYLYIPAMAEHENPRNPQRPDVPLPPWVLWNPNPTDHRKGSFEHLLDGLMGCTTHQTEDSTVPAPPRPAPPCTDPSKDKTKGVSLSETGLDESTLGYWMDKTGREPKPADLRSLKTILNAFGPTRTTLAIGQAVMQGAAADNYALITTIARGEAS